jgi:hypothetical protein
MYKCFALCPKNNDGVSGGSVSTHKKDTVLNVVPLRFSTQSVSRAATVIQQDSTPQHFSKHVLRHFLKDGLVAVVQFCGHIGASI